MAVFPASDFALEEVRQLSVAALRAKFTQYPRALDGGNTDDALHIDNYVLSGPDLNYVVGAATVDGDRQSIDLYLAAPLAIGDWQLTVSNIVEDTSEALMPPITLPFKVTFVLSLDPLGHGAVNEEHVNIIRKFLNPALKGKGWGSMIAGLASADQRNADNARLAFDQLFLSTASELYLDRRASDEGIQRPRGVNMSDDLFRRLAISQRNGKLTQKAILDILEIFYGRDATRAYSDTAASETYALQDGDELVILFEERNTVTVRFERGHFARIGMATAQEVAAAISRACRDAGNAGLAVAYPDSISGKDKVRIYSGTLGLTSSIRIIGGRGNVVLLFPTSLFTKTGSSPFATWDIEFSPETQGNLRFTMTAGTEYDLFLVHEGDLAYIYGDEFADSANGTYTIEAVSVTDTEAWFEIENPLGEEAPAVIQTGFADLMFFRPKRKTIYDNARQVVVCENDGYLDIVIPATTEVVDRGPGLAAYLNGADALAGENFSLSRTGNGVVSIDVDATHGLVVGDQVIIDGMLPTGEVPDTDAGTPSGNFVNPNDSEAGTTNASIHSTASVTGTYEGVYSRAIRDGSGRLVIVGGATTPDGVTFTPKDNLTALEVTGESVSLSGGRAVDYLWTQVASDGAHGLNTPNFGYRNFGASLLGDGRILCSGGSIGDDVTGTPIAGWDLLQFLPPDSVSQQSGPLPAARASHAQCAIPDGPDAIVCGGWTVAGTPLVTTLRFISESQTWDPQAPMNLARMHHELVALPNGLTFIAIGGCSNGANTAMIHRCEILELGSSWTYTGNMTYARIRFGVVTIPDGRIVVIGGRGYEATRTASPGTLNTCEIYDPHTGLWSMLPPMRNARENAAVVFMPDHNEIWVAGGANSLQFVEALNVSTMKWRTVTQAQLPSFHNATRTTGGLVGDDVFAMVGGDFFFGTETVNHVLIPGEDKLWLGAGINGTHSVAEVPDGTHVKIYTREYDFTGSYSVARAGANITPMGAEAAPATVPGPFSYDPRTGLAITETNGTTDTVFNRGVHYSSLHLEGVDQALKFPDEEGWLVFNFGYKNQVGPIRYLGRLSDEDLILDAAVPFSSTLMAGATVRLLTGRTPYQPAADHLVGSFYVTGTAAGREAARKIIDDIIAAGKQVLVSVIYPGDRGLGAEGYPQGGNYKLSDKVGVWGGDELDSEIPAARLGP
jgi:hypothetical protein